MSAPRRFVFLLGLAGLAVGHAAEPVSLDPVGFVKIGGVAGDGGPALPAYSEGRFSVPMETELECRKEVVKVSGNKVTLFGDSQWEENKWAPSSGTTYSLVVSSGEESGLRGLITASGANSVTVQTTTPGDLGKLTVGTKVEIREAWTLKSFFAEASLSPGVQVMFFDGEVPGVNLAPTSITVWSGSNWYYIFGAPVPAPPNANNLILHPAESFVVRTNWQAIQSLPVSGSVPSSDHRMAVNKLLPGVGQDTTLGYFSPVPELLGESGLGLNPGDQLLAFESGTSGYNKSPREILVYSGSKWFPVYGISGDVQSTYSLKPGAGYVFRQASYVAPGVGDWKDTPSYLEEP